MVKLTSTKFGSEFDSAPLEQKRMMVLFDALDAVISKITMSYPGTYISRIYDSQRIKDNPAQICRACAIGSIFLSYCRFENENGFTYYKAAFTLLTRAFVCSQGSPDPLPKLFREMFSEDQLFLIEECFEDFTSPLGRRVSLVYRKKSLEKHRWAIYWYRQNFPEPTDRFLVILYNMIANDGVFVPHKDFND